jgi:putative hemolysin
MEELIVIAVCLLFNAVLAGAEMAFVTIPKSQLRQLKKAGDLRAEKVLELRKHPERTLSVIQIGITLVGAVAAAVGGAGAEESISPILMERFGVSENVAEALSILLVVLPITYFNVVVGELVPKSIALRNPARLILRNVGWLYWFDRTLSPLVTLLEGSTRLFMKLMPGRSRQTEAVLPSETVDLDQLSSQTRQYVVNLVTIEMKRIRDVMLPWSEVVVARSEQSPAEIERLILSSGHTRLPVLKNEILAGVMNTKEFMSLRASGAENWETVIRNALHVQESDALPRVLRMMQESRSHLCAVYAGSSIVGIVTMEDILEEVIGEIFDEDDDGKFQKVLSTGSTFRTIAPRID